MHSKVGITSPKRIDRLSAVIVRSLSVFTNMAKIRCPQVGLAISWHPAASGLNTANAAHFPMMCRDQTLTL